MSETKSEAFHRLAGQRIEAILDKIRIFGNLASPSYEWTPEEVISCFEQIEDGLKTALARFEEQKRWNQSRPMTSLFVTLTPDPQQAAVSYDGPVENEDTEEQHEPAPDKYKRRSMTIAELLAKVEREGDHILAEQIALQREVIDGLQTTINELRRTT